MLRGCVESLMSYGIFLMILGFIAAPFVIAAATAALPFVVVFGGIWFLVKILRSRWMNDYLQESANKEAMRRLAQQTAARPASSTGSAPTPPVPTIVVPSFPSRAPVGVLAHASGRPFRVCDAAQAQGQRLQRPLLWADEYDDGQIQGYALYGSSGGGVTILSSAEFQHRYRRWIE